MTEAIDELIEMLKACNAKVTLYGKPIATESLKEEVEAVVDQKYGPKEDPEHPDVEHYCCHLCHETWDNCICQDMDTCDDCGEDYKYCECDHDLETELC